MPQLELPFDTVQLRTEFNVHRYRKRKIVEASLTLYEQYDFAVISIEYSGKFERGLERRMIRLAHEAYRLRKVRPYGDEYWTPDGSVFYLTELVL